MADFWCWCGLLTLALAALVWAWKKPLRDVDRWLEDVPDRWRTEWSP